ncbi:hypothetical protein [Halodesulfovibrio marinisediminis]|uniref:Uncharacterized protein n=1 Tax=Halodesulfovibrio marinisediminis DSM 17456 TaxID=1121457 RepID=A0A1N6FN63_9BACT|nr:hypothetical protein [Halodesulfovibrio marinisediminis]SIN96757.1 hypothetical protein SAMN02745161_1409 [Halodesulfovibrio marinisediminis DSM 17456]
MSTSVRTYSPSLTSDQEVNAILGILVFDMLVKILRLFPSKDVLRIDNNHMYERLGANCYLTADISKLMKENASKQYKYGNRVYVEDSLSINLYHTDNRLNSLLSGGGEVYVIKDEANRLVWFKNEAQELSFPIAGRTSETEPFSLNIAESSYFTASQKITAKDFRDLNKLVHKEDFVLLEVVGDRIQGLRMEDGRRYSLDDVPDSIEQATPDMLLKSYHFLPIVGKDYDVRLANVDGAYVLHSQICFTPLVDIDVYEYVRPVQL